MDNITLAPVKLKVMGKEFILKSLYTTTVLTIFLMIIPIPTTPIVMIGVKQMVAEEVAVEKTPGETFRSTVKK